jgi:hypothetical protein
VGWQKFLLSNDLEVVNYIYIIILEEILLLADSFDYEIFLILKKYWYSLKSQQLGSYVNFQYFDNINTVAPLDSLENNDWDNEYIYPELESKFSNDDDMFEDFDDEHSELSIENLSTISTNFKQKYSKIKKIRFCKYWDVQN